MEGLNNNFENIGDKKDLEEALWTKAEELSIFRQSLQKEMSDLEILFKEKPSNKLNLHEREQRREEESLYWETKQKIEDVVAEEKRLENVINDLDNDVANNEEIMSFIPKQTSEERKISKRKMAIMEEAQRIGTDPRNILNEMYREFGNNKMHLTTGRHATKIKNLGNIDPLTAENEFFYRTTDTHGGKVDYGKDRGNYYVSSSGKRIRKK